MTSDELDRALEEALSVEPPAGYAARVRARVAAEQGASAGRYGWRPLGALAAAVLVLVAGGLILERDDDPARVATVASPGGQTLTAPGDTAGPSRTSRQPTTPGETEPAAAVAAGTAPVEPARDEQRNSAAHTEASRRIGDALPAVLISPDDSAGPHLLVALPEAALAASVTENAERQEPQISRIDVAPIRMDPLPPLTPLALGELQ